MPRRKPSITIEDLIAELRPLYLPPFGSPRTWRRLATVLRQLGAVGGVIRAADLTPAAIGRWLAASPHLSPVTARTYLGAVRHACIYCVHRGYLARSPFEFRSVSAWAKGYERGEAPPRRVRHHPIDSIHRVIRHLAEDRTWEGRRLHALVATTFLTGARATEVQAATAADFDLAGRTFAIEPNERRRLKTPRSRRTVVMPPDLVEVLSAWLPECGSRWAFPAKLRATPWTGGPYGDRPIDRIKAAGLACGVERFTFLSLRHSYVTHSRTLWGIPAALTQQLCGHTEPSTTEGYTGFDLANALEAVGSIRLGASAA